MFELVSVLKLLDIKEDCRDLEMGPDFSSSIALDALSNLEYMKFKHLMMFSDSLLGWHCWILFSSDRIALDSDFGKCSEENSTFFSRG